MQSNNLTYIYFIFEKINFQNLMIFKELYVYIFFVLLFSDIIRKLKKFIYIFFFSSFHHKFCDIFKGFN